MIPGVFDPATAFGRRLQRSGRWFGPRNPSRPSSPGRNRVLWPADESIRHSASRSITKEFVTSRAIGSRKRVASDTPLKYWITRGLHRWSRTPYSSIQPPHVSAFTSEVSNCKRPTCVGRFHLRTLAHLVKCTRCAPLRAQGLARMDSQISGCGSRSAQNWHLVVARIRLHVGEAWRVSRSQCLA